MTLHPLAGNGVSVFDAYSLLADENGSTMPEYSEDLLHLALAGYEELNRDLVPLLHK